MKKLKSVDEAVKLMGRLAGEQAIKKSRLEGAKRDLVDATMQGDESLIRRFTNEIKDLELYLSSLTGALAETQIQKKSLEKKASIAALDNLPDEMMKELSDSIFPRLKELYKEEAGRYTEYRRAVIEGRPSQYGEQLREPRAGLSEVVRILMISKYSGKDLVSS